MKHDEASRGRILLVDDSPDVLEVFSLCLEEAGYQISKTWDSAQAFAMAQRSPPDAIIMDFWMPQLNGLELAALVKADPNLATIPIGLITAAAGILPSLITSHFLTVLAKPAALQDLVLMAEALIAARYATRRPELFPLSL